MADDIKGPVAVTKKNPSDFLKQVLGRPVVVKLNSGDDYRGILFKAFRSDDLDLKNAAIAFY